MSRIDLDKSRVCGLSPKTVCHVVPCRIHYTGSAKVHKYFKPREPSGIAYLRGRELRRHKIVLPEGYVGAILQEAEVSFRDRQRSMIDHQDHLQDTRKFVVEESFKEINVWGHGTLPDPSHDPWICGMTDWIKVAQLLHQVDLPADKGVNGNSTNNS
jgi:hypothetical protein